VGHPVSVLMGHQAPVSFVNFHPAFPGVLLSSSFDGTCRLWDASVCGGPMHVLMAGPQPGVAMALWLPMRADPTPSGGTAAVTAQNAAAVPGGEDGGEGGSDHGEAGPSGAEAVGNLLFSLSGSVMVAEYEIEKGLGEDYGDLIKLSEKGGCQVVNSSWQH
jgi:WD40 repeat protein